MKLLVSEGDTVSQDQPVLELETDKATIEVPSPVSGTIEKVHVKDGEQIKVGQLVFTVDGKSGAAPSREAALVEQATPAGPQADRFPSKELAELVEAGPARAPASAAQPGAGPAPPPEALSAEKVRRELLPESPAEAAEPRVAAPAAPSVRRIAREIGVEITQVTGSGSGGRISTEDVKRHAREVISGLAQSGFGAAAAVSLPDFNKWGAVERKAMSQIRRKTADHLSRAWTSVPQVTQFDRADITNLEAIRHQYSALVEKAGGKLTLTAIALKVVASAFRVFPQFAASIDMAQSEIIYKQYCHIGVAVDTDRGLLVPVIRDVDQKNITQLSLELSTLAERARSKKLTLEEMEGGVFTITNLGGIGGTYFSPIVNYPEVAILGMSRARLAPVHLGGQFEPRLMLPLSLSYDHRLIDGADAARFLRWVAEALEQPFLLPLQG